MMTFQRVLLSNRYKFKRVPWRITVPKALVENRPVLGHYVFNVEDVNLSIESGPSDSRMTSTRIMVGGTLLGSTGLILGALMKKDTTYFALVFETRQGTFRVTFPRRQWVAAREFIEAVAYHAAWQVPVS